jgi:lipid A 3-O-deacylase
VVVRARDSFRQASFPFRDVIRHVPAARRYRRVRDDTHSAVIHGSAACVPEKMKAIVLSLSLALAHAAAAGASLAASTSGEPAAPTDIATRSAWAPTAFFAQAGRARETTTLTAGLQWDWKRTWYLGERARVTGYNEVSIGHWRADSGGGDAIVTQIGITPVFRFWPSGSTSGWFYEGAVGVNVLTPVYRTREKRFSTAFNFGDHVAVGYRNGSGRRSEWSLRIQHYSNAGIQHPNPGEDFLQLRYTVPL